MNYFQKVKYNKDYFEKYNKTLMRGQKPLYNRFWIRYLRKIISKGRILDAGCGRGFFLEYAEKNFKTYGIDVSQYGLNQAKQKSMKSDFCIGIVNQLSYKSGTFDIVTSFDLLEHLEHPAEAIREFNRVLKKNGILVISVPNIYSIGKKWKKEDWFGYRDKTHQTLLANHEWLEIINKNGFKIKEVKYDGLWDSPYFIKMPISIQHLVFKIPVSFLFWLGYRFPREYGENICIIAIKNMEV